jgi:hypothetical protein
MTMPDERTKSAVYAGAFLRDLLDPKITPRVSKDVRTIARWLLRHYPDPWHFQVASEAVPDYWGPPPKHAHWRDLGEKK